ncbi:complex 1 protein [Xylariomycetidae sp. FL2044]|nr:complex 1 protein [Xylariomycetidae sp. FL2044]
MSGPNPVLRRQVIAIYKGPMNHIPSHVPPPPTSPPPPSTGDKLLNLGKDYPQGFSYFRPRLHKAFMASAHLRDEEDIRKGIARAEFVKKEIEAL